MPHPRTATKSSSGNAIFDCVNGLLQARIHGPSVKYGQPCWALRWPRGRGHTIRFSAADHAAEGGVEYVLKIKLSSHHRRRT